MVDITLAAVLGGGLQGELFSQIFYSCSGSKTYASMPGMVDRLRKALQGEKRPLNYDLERAVLNCLLRAQLDITEACLEQITKEFKPFGEFISLSTEPSAFDWLQPRQRAFEKKSLEQVTKEGKLFGKPTSPSELSEKRSAFEWLQKRQKALKEELKRLAKSEQPEIPLQTLAEIGTLVQPNDGQDVGASKADEQDTDRSKVVEDKSLAAITRDPQTPEIFKQEARRSLMALIHAYFVFEIKHNQVVRDIFSTQLLAQIGQSQQKVLLTLKECQENLRATAASNPDMVSKLDALEQLVLTLRPDMHDGFVAVLTKLDEFTDRFDNFGLGIATLQTLIDNRFEELKAYLEAKQSNQPARDHTNLPRSGVVEFVGRGKALEDLHKLLNEDTRLALTAVRGMGGIGKTELALQYSLYHFEQGTYPGGVCWLQARTVDVGTQLVLFARTKLGLQLPDDLNLAAQVSYCYGHWPAGNVLLVFDDVTDYETIEPYLPPAQSRIKVLLTTRKDFGKSVKTYPLGMLDEASALNLLRKWIEDNRIDAELEKAKTLCFRLGYLPLALELVGRYLARKRDLSIEAMLDRLAEKGLTSQALTKAELGMTGELGVRAAFDLSWAELQEDAQAQDLARLLSLFALAPFHWQSGWKNVYPIGIAKH